MTVREERDIIKPEKMKERFNQMNEYMVLMIELDQDGQPTNNIEVVENRVVANSIEEVENKYYDELDWVYHNIVIIPRVVNHCLSCQNQTNGCYQNCEKFRK